MGFRKYSGQSKRWTCLGIVGVYCLTGRDYRGIFGDSAVLQHEIKEPLGSVTLPESEESVNRYGSIRNSLKGKSFQHFRVEVV